MPMHEYKGKHSLNEWIFGSLLYYNGLPYIVPDDGDLSLLDKYRVVESSICEHTGLYNHGENDIWEHDVIEERGNLYEVKREYDCPGGHWANSGFILRGIDISDFMSFEDSIDDYTNEICVEIVGNVFDSDIAQLKEEAKEKEKEREAAEKRWLDSIYKENHKKESI